MKAPGVSPFANDPELMDYWAEGWNGAGLAPGRHHEWPAPFFYNDPKKQEAVEAGLHDADMLDLWFKLHGPTAASIDE
jgi:hypothetical protein